MNFTQYLMPDGRKKLVTIDRSPEIEAMAAEVEARGYTFENELLSDYATVSMECTCGDDIDDIIASELVPNGPEVPPAVDRLVRTAHAALTQITRP